MIGVSSKFLSLSLKGMTMPITFQVKKSDLATTRIQTAEQQPLANGEVRLSVDRFALTSNNITYAAFGDAMNYWQFFPTNAADQAEGWGIIPVWGFATVTESSHADVALGERFYGYYPMSTEVVMQPAKASPRGFADGAAHRASLHGVYNQYTNCASDPFYDRANPSTEDIQALLRPLFITSWLIDDFFADNQFFGASAALLSSASSKTAYGTAHEMKKRGSVKVIGLTSAANKAFCESLGCYDQVLTYDELSTLDAATNLVYVDFAGNAALRRTIHAGFSNLKYSCSIGGTHVTDLGSAKDLAGVKPVLFFAPAQVKKRSEEWGGAEFGKRMVQAWQGFTKTVTESNPTWLQSQYQSGVAAVSAVYAQVLAGKGDARVGHMLTLL
jgi:Protein of unknown function (DUF2855)